MRRIVENLDFVHLWWNSYDTDPPYTDGLYLFLVRRKDYDFDDNCVNYPYKNLEVIPLKVVIYKGELCVMDLYDNICSSDCLIAWADPKKPTFTCDPKLASDCTKTSCSFLHIGGACSQTTDINHARYFKD